MWYYVKWTFWIIVWVLVGAFFHYTLPQNDIVRVADTYEKRVDFGENSWFWASSDVGNAQTTVNRDVFFIQTIQPNGKPMIYRNEDTGWGWPPYFKFDTSNLQAEAKDAVSKEDNPNWVAIRHYGWRNEYISIFPNAVGLKPVAGPDTQIIPWLNIVILTLFFAFVWAVYVRIRRFRKNRIDPALADVDEAFDKLGDNAEAARLRAGGWLNSWRGPQSRR